MLTYAIVTPVRDEVENLRRLGASLAAQTTRPERWVVVDNGSDRPTLDVIEALARAHSWIGAVAAPGHPNPLPGAPIVKAFHAGLGALGSLGDIVVKLDADVSLEPHYFEHVLRAFAADEQLGIAGGVCLELREGIWQEVTVTGTGVRGAARAYRRACLEQLLPLPECMGWDGVDELKAGVLGWKTELIPGISFRHHRRLGERDGGAHRRWVAQGRGAHYMGYRFSYLLLRSVYRARREPAALAMPWGYVQSALRRRPRFQDDAVRAHLRRQQSFLRLPGRLRSARARAS